MKERDYRYPRGVVTEQPPLITVRWTDKRTGLRWRGTGVSLDAIRDSWAHAAVTGSVGDNEYMNMTYCGGCEYLIAQTHRIDEHGNDIPPKG